MDELILKIRIITLRVVRGKAALRQWQVGVSKGIRIVSIILTALGSAGLIAKSLEGGPPNQGGWALYLWVAMLVVSILIQLANEFGINTFALESRLLAESCKVIGLQLDNCLSNSNPTEIVAKILTDINEITVKYANALPDKTVVIEEDARGEADNLVAVYSENWKLPLRQRRAK